MASSIDIDAIRAANPISSVVGRYIKLRRAGREYQGLCPFHDDHTPSLGVNDQKGVFYCHACEASGDLFKFVMDYERVGFLEAVEIVVNGRDFGFFTPPKPAKPAKADDNGRRALEIWNTSSPIIGTVGDKYLERRGIVLAKLTSDLPLRFKWLPHKGLPGEWPTLVAAFTDLNGNVTGIEQIILTRDGQKIDRQYPARYAKPCLGPSNGNAIKLGSGTDNIILAESLEDGLSLFQSIPGSTVWAVAGTAKLKTVRLPDKCGSVIIAPDNDKAGRGAADAAEAVFHAQGRKVARAFPQDPFKDWNEQLQAEQHA